ncbi:MAG: IS4/IS5 family transposase, partial [Clostridia bacterium]
MSDYAKEVREALRKEIAELSKIAWLFSQHPEKDFTRKSPLQFSKLVESLICMGGNSIQLELLKLFHMNQKTPTTSAFVQQRGKIMPEAFEYLFQRFNAHYSCWKTFEGYRLLACDGSDIVYRSDAPDTNNYISNKDGTGYYVQHLN